MKPQIAHVSSRMPAEPYYRYDCYLSSLHRYGEASVNLGEGVRWDGLNTKPFLLRDWLRAGKNESDRILFTDAWDILWLKHPHWVNDRCIEWFGPEAIVFNGEKAIWPCANLAEFFPDTGPRRYLNSGVMIGPADKILVLLEDMDLESIGVDRQNPDGTWVHPNDQAEMQRMFARQYEPATCFDERPYKMVVDGSCRLAMTFSATEPQDYDLVDHELKCNLTGTTPGIGHFNGDGQNKHMHKFLEHWNLP